MRRSFRIALVGAMLAGVLAVSAAAADYTSCAEQLDKLGLFEGTGQGYALDRTPTRAEAAVMLVRLLGAEQDALALEYAAPFADLYEWQQPYVQYLYENGLTTGVSATAFAPERACSAQMYAAFSLRALGYSEASGDFTYAQALDFAEQIGLYDPAVVDTADFRRDDAVAASYTALSLSPKGEDGMLLDRLVRDGSVDVQTAAPYQERFSLYTAYRQGTAGMASLSQYTVQEALAVSVSGADVYLRTQGSTTVDLENDKAVSEGKLTLEADGVDPYTQSYSLDTSEQAGLVRAGLRYGYGAVPLAFVETMDHAGSKWTFTFTSMPAQYEGCLWALAHAGGAFEQTGEASLVQTVQNGRVSSQTLTVTLAQGDSTLQAVLSGKLTTAK